MESYIIVNGNTRSSNNINSVSFIYLFIIMFDTEL